MDGYNVSAVQKRHRGSLRGSGVERETGGIELATVVIVSLRLKPRDLTVLSNWELMSSCQRATQSYQRCMIVQWPSGVHREE